IVTVETHTSTVDIHYARLVIALGAVIRTLPIPGLDVYALGFKSLEDAIALRNHVLRKLEEADAEEDPDRAEAHLTFVFVGGGYAGVEAVGELSDRSATPCATTHAYRSAGRGGCLSRPSRGFCTRFLLLLANTPRGN